MSIEDIFHRAFGNSRRVPSMNEIRRATFTPETRAVNAEKREITFVSSTERTDRYGDIIRVAGWDTKEYLKNPVVLWSHRSGDPPVGKTTALSIETNPSPALVQTVQFATKDMNPLADQIFNLYQGGFLKSVSVGFRPTVPPKPIVDADGDWSGFEFNGQELLELSCCGIPANPDAVARAIDAGLVTKADASQFFKESENKPTLADLKLDLELELLQIAGERLTLATLEAKCNNLLAQLKESSEVDSLEKLFASGEKEITSLTDLERLLRGGA